MTLKHINFYDSPVMRELERQAVKKGTFKTASVEQVVKRASVKKSFAPSNDLYSDMLALASGLRDRGFVKEADALENKIFIRKQAETHLYRAIDEDAEDLLDFAHPDGDAKVSDAKDQNGVVETISSQHKKIVDIVNKQPNGKYAKVVDNIILATAGVLGVSIKKSAAGKDELNEEEESLLSGEPGKKQKSIGAANKFLAGNYAKVNELIKDSVGEFNSSAWRFSEEALMNPANADLIKAYVKYSKVNPADLTKWTTMAQLFGNEAGREQAVSAYITKNAGSPNLVTWANQVQAGLGNYFTGTQPSEDKRKITALANGDPEGILAKIFQPTQESISAARAAVVAPWFADNPNSILKITYSAPYNIGTTIDYQKVSEAVKTISQAVTNFHNSVLGQDKLEAASTAYVTEAKAYFDGLAQAGAVFAEEPHLDDATSFLPVMKELAGMHGALQKFDAKGDEGKKLTVLKNYSNDLKGWAPKAFANVPQATKLISDMIDYLNSNPLTEGESVIADDKAANAFLSIAKIYHANAKKNPAQAATYKKNKRLALNLYKMLQGVQGKPFSDVAPEISKYYPKTKSYAALVGNAQKWLSDVSSELGEQPEEITKNESVFLDGKLVSLGQAPSGPAAGGGGGGAPRQPGQPQNSGAVNLTRANMNDPNEANTALMQQYLAYFAQGLSSESNKAKFKDYNQGDVAQIVRTGPKANPTVNSYDGKWGPQTQQALELAKKYLDQLGVTGLDTKARYVNRQFAPDTADVAKHNAALLGQANAALGVAGATGAGGKEYAVFDKLPRTVNFTDEANSSPDQGTVPVTSEVLASMGSFYKFLVNTLGVAPQTVESAGLELPSRGFSFMKWDEIFAWFIKRVKYLFSIAKDDKAGQNVRNYHAALMNLWNQRIAIARSMGIRTSEDLNKILPEDKLPGSFSGSPGRGAGDEAGSSYQQKGKGRGRGQGAGAGGMEGTRTRLPGPDNNAPPIMDQIDLRHPLLNMDYQDMGLTYPILRLDAFQRTPGPRMAQALFTNEIGDKEAQAKVLEQLGVPNQPYPGYPHNLGWNDEYNTYIIRFPDGSQRPANALQGFGTKLEEVMKASPSINYQKFLNTLQKNINSAFSQWANSGASAEEISAMEEYHNRWTQAIAKQYRDITRRR